MENKIGLTLFVAFIILLAGTVYFQIYNTANSNTALAYFFYIATAMCFIAAVIYGRKNIKSQVKEGYSAVNWKKTVTALIYLIVGGGIIDVISKTIGGQAGFTIGLVLAIILFLGLFVFFRENKK